MINEPLLDDEDTKPYAFTEQAVVSTLDLFTVDVPRRERLIPFEPITTRRKLANTLRQLANVLEGVK